jgi:hypothetical protein
MDDKKEPVEKSEDPTEEPKAEPKTGWQYSHGSGVSNTEEPKPPTPIQSVDWESVEFIAHEKSFGWYFILVLGTVVLATALFIVTRDVISTLVIVVVAIIFGVIAGRKPRVLKYNLGYKGITVGNSFRAYSDFRSFAIIEEGDVKEIILMPLKRFMPPLNLYVSPAEEPEVVQALSNYIPLDQTHGNDFVDRLVKRIRF